MKTLLKLMNKPKLFFVLFLAIIINWSLASSVLALMPDRSEEIGENTVGCCKKFDKAAPDKYTTQDTIKADCEKIADQYAKVEWDGTKRALGNECAEKLDQTPVKSGEAIKFTPEVTIPGSKFVAGQEITLADSTKPLAEYIIAILKYAIGIIGIISAIVLMLGGVKWLTAAGNSSAVSESKTMIVSSLTGLILTIGSFLLLSTINPNLTTLKITPVKRIQYIGLEMGCCEKTDEQGNITTATISKDECAVIDYATTKFFKDQVAEANKCVDITGCCLLDIGTQTGLFEWPWGDDQVCINKVLKKDCTEKETSPIWSFVAGINFFKEDVDAEFYLGEKCQEVDDCDKDLICENFSECEQKLILREQP